MSKVKHLLRKLHIGGGSSSSAVGGGGGGGGGFADHHPHHHHNRPVSDPPPPTPLLNSTLLERTTGAVENSNSNSNSTSSNQLDFNFFEEEFQVQLALAISVSDPDAREDPEMAQIKAAEQISLGRSPIESPFDFLSFRYWSYNVVNYDEKVVDGFYDVYGTTSSAVAQGKIPSLVDLQAVSVLDSVNYEVILVNRGADMELRMLEERVYLMSLEYRGLDKGLAMGTLIQRIADLVVDRMGGPVSDANEMLKRWTVRSYELKSSLNSIILPLGCLDIGISRHRALLFKVLADRVHLPCMLVKGSYYTGTDDGAVNLIKIDDQSEFIIDLMGAPGALIPSEVPGGCLQNSGLHINARSAISDAVNDLSWALSNGSNTEAVSSDLARDASVSMQLKWDDRNVVEKSRNERSEYNFGKFFLSPERLDGGSSGSGKESRAKNMQANDVSQYVISAAEDPEFTQKLHAGLGESGTSPPSVLFSDVDFSNLGELKVLEKVQLSNGNMVVDRFQYRADDHSLIPFSGLHFVGDTYDDSRTKASSVGLAADKPALKSIASNSLSDVITDGLVVVNAQRKKVIQPDNESAGVIVDSSGMASRISDGPQDFVLFMSSVASPFRVPQPNNDLDGKGDDNLKGRLGMVFSNIEKDIACSSQHTACITHDESISPVLGEVAEWEIPWEDLQIGERIGIGSYGEVYRAEWNGTEVAVKKFMNQDISGDALVQFKCEIEIMLRLRHPNVVLFMGAVTRPPNLSILTEFLPRGSLFKLLHRPNIQIDEKRRLKMALDVAKGMNYLHTSHPVIVHRDLKTPNLLVDKNWVVKVCDFGMSRIKHHTFLSSRSTAGTAEWMAPEVLRNEPSNEKSDVYSFGVILWELATLEVPWTGMNSMQVVGAVGFQNRHLKIPDKVDPVVAEIITDCWNFDAQARPSFGQIISRLRCLQRLCVEKPETLTHQDWQ